MKNLKKVVALSLAAVMMFGMMVVGAGAASYKDTADSDYTTAIDVVSALKVISGSNGNFNPNGELVRADAAILLARVELGADMASKLSAYTSAFSDVPANAYYANYVAWAQKQGYIKGDNGKYDPMGKLQGIAFAKLLLNVLGFEDSVENWGGTPYSWSEFIFNVNYEAARVGLLNGLEGIDLEATITREQAAQMAFNAIVSDVRVAYDSELGIVDGNLTNVYDRYEYTTGTLFDKSGLTTTTANDATTGLPIVAWVFDKATEDDPTPTYTADDYLTVSIATPAVIKTGAFKADALKDYTIDATLATTIGDVNQDVDNVGDAADIAAMSGNGVTLGLYIDADKEIYAIVETIEVLDEIETVKTDRDENVVRVDLKNSGESYYAATEKDPATPGFATLVDLVAEEETVVLLEKTTILGKDAEYTVIGAPEVAEGKVTKYNATALTMAGDELKFAKNSARNIALGKTNYAYLDTNGFVLDVNESKTLSEPKAPDYVYVTEIWAVNSNNTKDDSTYHFSGVTMAGEKIEGQYVPGMVDTNGATANGYDTLLTWATVAADGKSYTIADDDATDDAVNAILAYSYDEENDLYTLSDKEVTYNEDGTYASHDAIAFNSKTVQVTEADDKITVTDGIAANDTLLGTNFYASDVKFVFLKNAKGKVAPTVADGVQKVATDNVTYYYFTTEDSVGNELVSLVFVVGAPAAADEEPPAFVDGIYYVANTIANTSSTGYNYTSVVEDKDGKQHTLVNFTVYVDGVETTLDLLYKDGAVVNGEDSSVAAGFYKVVVDELGAATLTGVVAATSTTQGATMATESGDITDGLVIKYVNNKYMVSVDNGTTYVDATNAEVLDLTEAAEHATVRDLYVSASNYVAENAEEGDIVGLTIELVRNATNKDTSVVQIVVTGYELEPAAEGNG